MIVFLVINVIIVIIHSSQHQMTCYSCSSQRWGSTGERERRAGDDDDDDPDDDDDHNDHDNHDHDDHAHRYLQAWLLQLQSLFSPLSLSVSTCVSC